MISNKNKCNFNNLINSKNQPQHPVVFFSSTLNNFFSKYSLTFGSASLYSPHISYIFLESWNLAGPLLFQTLKSLVSKCTVK